MLLLLHLFMFAAHTYSACSQFFPFFYLFIYYYDLELGKKRDKGETINLREDKKLIA